MDYSIIIPARNEQEFVGKAVRAAASQNVRRESYEIIVVDNGSTDKTAEVAHSAGADKVVFEPRIGTNIARQKGFAASSGFVVAFLDADCEPPHGWLCQIREHLREDGVSAVSGPYEYGFCGVARFLDRAYAWHFFSWANRFLSHLPIRPTGILRAGNFAAYRSVIEGMGGLPPFTFWGDDTAIATTIAGFAGRVRYTRLLVVKSSPRRFQDGGLIFIALKYLFYFFRTYFRPAPQ